jgi:hypothetical protein
MAPILWLYGTLNDSQMSIDLGAHQMCGKADDPDPGAQIQNTTQGMRRE